MWPRAARQLWSHERTLAGPHGLRGPRAIAREALSARVLRVVDRSCGVADSALVKSPSLKPSFVRTVAAVSAVAAVCVPYIVRADPPPRPAACPSAAPVRGAACTTENLTCGYAPCGDHWVVNATCQGSPPRWAVVEASCNPPPPQVLPQMPTANPPPPGPPPVAGPPIRPGRRACSFVENGNRYDRQCTVTRQPDASRGGSSPLGRASTPTTPSRSPSRANLPLPRRRIAHRVRRVLGRRHRHPRPLEGTGRTRAFRVRWGQCEIAIKP